jgi:hypothetical protein
MYMIILHIHNIGNINLTEEFSVSLSHSYLVKSHVARRPSPAPCTSAVMVCVLLVHPCRLCSVTQFVVLVD